MGDRSDEISRFSTDAMAQAEAIAAGFRRLWELRVDVRVLTDIAATDAHRLLERIQTEIEELEGLRPAIL